MLILGDISHHLLRSFRRKWQPTPVFLPEESHGQRRGLVGYSLGSCKELDTTERAFPNKIKSNLFFPFVFGLVPHVYRVLSEASHLALQTRVPCRKWRHGHRHLSWTRPVQKFRHSGWRLWAVCRDAASALSCDTWHAHLCPPLPELHPSTL